MTATERKSLLLLLVNDVQKNAGNEDAYSPKGRKKAVEQIKKDLQGLWK